MACSDVPKPSPSRPRGRTGCGRSRAPTEPAGHHDVAAVSSVVSKAEPRVRRGNSHGPPAQEHATGMSRDQVVAGDDSASVAVSVACKTIRSDAWTPTRGTVAHLSDRCVAAVRARLRHCLLRRSWGCGLCVGRAQPCFGVPPGIAGVGLGRDPLLGFSGTGSRTHCTRSARSTGQGAPGRGSAFVPAEHHR